MNSEELNFSDPQILRLRAEELLKEKQVKQKKSFIESDKIKLMHELQVHQIELEMQNEELINANETAELALKKYTMLYDLAPIGYFILEFDGTISDLNFSGADILGERRFSLLNSNFKLFISEKSKQVFSDFFRKIFTDSAKESCKVILEDDNNLLTNVYIEGIVTGDDGKCLLSVIDCSKFNNQKNI